jgi:hypothetical protein
VQDEKHIAAIVAVAKLTRQIAHWIPTRELKMWLDYEAKHGALPSNLCVRVSATMVDGPATKQWAATSGVHTREDSQPTGTWFCPAKAKYNNTCGPCRKCWDPKVKHVSYPLH